MADEIMENTLTITQTVKNFDRFWRINVLSAAKKQELNDMLRHHSPKQVAMVMQNEWKQSTDIKLISLSHLLEKYRKMHIPISEIVSPYMTTKILAGAKKSLDILSEYSDLIELQKERLRCARLTEIELGKLSPEVTKEVHTMARLLKNYGEIGVRSGLQQQMIQQYLGGSCHGGVVSDKSTQHVLDMFAMKLLAIQEEFSEHTE